jgi:hypothetical protein
MFHTRREDILSKILKRVRVEYLGFELHGIPSPCHIWTGPDSGNGRGGGYGRICIDGQTCAVHIVIFTHFFGYKPSKKQVDHLCNNRLCCNPDHLVLVTHLKNQRLRAKRARDKKHEDSRKALHGVSRKEVSPV